MADRFCPSVRRTGLNRVRRGSVRAVIIGAIGAVVLAGVGVALFASIRADQNANDQKQSEFLANMTGLGRPIKNTLASEFVDANKDLVADAPSDAAKQLDPSEIVFSYVASEGNPGLAATFKPFTDAIGAAVGKPIRYLPFTDVDAQLHALHDGQLHVCALNTGAVPSAVDVAGFVPLAVLGSDTGPSTYQLKVIASTKSNITSVENLRGHELTLTEMSSNSGFKAPLVLLQQKFSMRPGFDFGIRYSLGQMQSIDGLVNGTFDAVAVASDVLAREEKEGKISAGQYKVLYTSDPFPTACFGYTHNLKPELVEKLRKAMVDYHFGTDATAGYFAASGQTRLVKLDYAKDFAIVREVDDAIGYEHKLRAVQTSADAPTTEPTTQPIGG